MMVQRAHGGAVWPQASPLTSLSPHLMPGGAGRSSGWRGVLWLLPSPSCLSAAVWTEPALGSDPPLLLPGLGATRGAAPAPPTRGEGAHGRRARVLEPTGAAATLSAFLPERSVDKESHPSFAKIRGKM